MVETVAYSLVEKIVSDYVGKIVEKASAGKRLSDWEVGILMMDHIRSSIEGKMEGMRRDLEGKIGALEAKIGTLEGRIEAIEARMGALEKRLERVESGLESLRADMSSLRDNVINVLVAELKRRMEREV
ncbi:MAG: hypothetical protein BA066_05600 [Candidatus Korarchaeota archaeon NZ13-K]|nr:MAG: hypothetical protein BA066_05600 [Candidatus Korarchaeota archaeon NZ13-K]